MLLSHFTAINVDGCVSELQGQYSDPIKVIFKLFIFCFVATLGNSDLLLIVDLCPY